jgi:hypothetical protein
VVVIRTGGAARICSRQRNNLTDGFRGAARRGEISVLLATAWSAASPRSIASSRR